MTKEAELKMVYLARHFWMSMAECRLYVFSSFPTPVMFVSANTPPVDRWRTITRPVDLAAEPRLEIAEAADWTSCRTVLTLEAIWK
jgi:hypothetical protein